MSDLTEEVKDRLRLVAAWKLPGGPRPDRRMPDTYETCMAAIREIEALEADRNECSKQTREALQRLDRICKPCLEKGCAIKSEAAQ